LHLKQDGEIAASFVVEVQRDRDPDKRWTWPAYWALVVSDKNARESGEIRRNAIVADASEFGAICVSFFRRCAARAFALATTRSLASLAR